MSNILSVGTALPPHALTQTDLAQFARRHFEGKLRRAEQLLQIFENTQIDARHLVVPLAWFDQPNHTWKERNDLYIAQAEAMSLTAAQQALDRAGLAPQDVDMLIYVSTSGLITPSMDARLITKLGMKATTKRLPIWGLGCAGGVAGLARALDWCKAYPDKTALLVVAETSSLTFQADDYTMKNFISCSLFADGAAAVVVRGDECGIVTSDECRVTSVEHRSSLVTRHSPLSSLHFLSSQSTLFPNSEHVMGWSVGDMGMEVILAPEIPARIARDLKPVVEQLLQPHGLCAGDIKHYIMHPGGARVLDAFDAAFDLQHDELRFSREVLRQHGNMSAPTALFVLEHILTSNVIQPGDYALIGAMGPGFSSELILVRS